MANVSTNPYDVWAIKGLSDSEFEALRGVDLGGGAYAGTTWTAPGGVTWGANQNEITGMEDIKLGVLEYLPTPTDDDNPYRPIGTDAVIHSKGSTSWVAIFSILVSTTGFRSNLDQFDRGNYLIYVETGGKKQSAIVEPFDMQDQAGSPMRKRGQLRNKADVIPHRRNVA